MRLPKNISILRKRAGLSQTQLGEALGRTNSQISLYEKGENFPPPDCLIKLTEVFDVSLDDLFFKDFENEPRRSFFYRESKDDPEFISGTSEDQKALYRMVNRMKRYISNLEKGVRNSDPELAEILHLMADNDDLEDLVVKKKKD